MMHYTLFGESHGPAVGVLLTDVPPGLPVDEVFIREQLLRRMGQGGLTTARQEKEEVHFLSGVYQGRTTGDPLAAVIYNGDARSADYDSLKHKPRPSHGDYTAAVRALGCNDPRGGGHTSGRLTAPLTVAGALAITYLKTAHIAVHADVLDEEALRARAAAAKADGDSVGGVIRCTVSGLPAGLGGPDWRAPSPAMCLPFPLPRPSASAQGRLSPKCAAVRPTTRLRWPVALFAQRPIMPAASTPASPTAWTWCST